MAGALIPQDPLQDDQNEQKPSPNRAPVKPLQDARKQQPFKQTKLLDWLKSLRDELKKEKESPEWQRRILNSQRNELFYKGLQRLKRADLSNTWRVLEPKPIHYTLNEFAFWVSVVVSKWINSRVDFRVTGLDDMPDKEAAAKKLLQIIQYYEDRDWTREATIIASKQCQFEGALIAYIYHDPTYGNRKAYRPVIERQVLKLGPDVARCADCGITFPMPDQASGLHEPSQPPVVPGSDAPEDGAPLVNASELDGGMPSEGILNGEASDPATQSCPGCGSLNLAVTQVPSVPVDQKVGEEVIDSGDVTHQLISIYNITWKARRGLKDSDVVLWEAEYLASELSATYPGIDLPQTGTTSFALNALANLENAGVGRNNAHNTAVYVLSRMWVEPTRYEDVQITEDIQLYDGSTIPAGTVLKEAFPEGLHVIMCGDLIVDLYSAVKNDDLVLMEYHSSPHGLPRGCDDMCEPQRQSNTAHSLMNVWMRHTAMPPMTYVDGVVEAGDLSGDLTKPIPLKGANFGIYEGVTPENAVMYRSGQPFQPGIFQYAEKLRSAIQLAAMETSFAAGLPDANNDTLGGAQIGQSLAQSISGVILAQFADFRAEIAKRKLDKFKKYCWDDRYVQFSGEYGLLEGQLLSATSIPDSFKIETVPNSWLPRIPEQQQKNLQSVLALVGGIPGLMSTPPELLAELCEVFDVKLTQNLYPIAVRTVRSRLEQAKEVLPMISAVQNTINQVSGGMAPQEVQLDPMTGMPVPVSLAQQVFESLQPPFNPREDGHEIAAQYLSKWFTTDEGLQASKDLIEFASILQDAHMQAIMLHNQAKMALAMSAQPPMPMGSAPADKGQPSPPKETGVAHHPVGG